MLVRRCVDSFMDCKIARQKLFDRLDCEIDATANGSLPLACLPELEEHLACCAACRREYRLLSFPRIAAVVDPPLTAPAWFHQRLCRRIEEEVQDRAGRQTVWKLAYKMVPALAGITLMLAAIFVWQEARPSTAFLLNYEYVFIEGDAAQRMIAGDQNDITYESVLAALAERHMDKLSRGSNGQ